MVGLKLDKFGGGTNGKRKGSGESDEENLEQMRSILSSKNWRNELASDCVSGVSRDELEGLRWRIEFKVFQSVRGLEDDSVTRFVRKLDLAFEIRDRTKLHWALIGASLRDDKACGEVWYIMVKSIKCRRHVVKSIECRTHVESS